MAIQFLQADLQASPYLRWPGATRQVLNPYCDWSTEVTQTQSRWVRGFQKWFTG